MSSKPTLQEEDIDDLDDIVDQFDTKPPNAPQPSTSVSNVPAQSTSAPSPSASSSKDKLDSSRSATASNADASSSQLPDDLAKQLAEGMESLMHELAESGHGPLSEEDRKRQEELEKLLIDGLDNADMNDLLDRESSDKDNETKQASAKKAADDFQTSILQAMEKLKDSHSKSQPSPSDSSSDDPLEDILNRLNAGLGESGEDNGDLQDMLETMMQQLMSKEVLYEPLKELHDKFPSYLSENEQKLSAEDKERFENQRTRVAAIVRIFEDPSYKDDDQEKGAQVVTLMNEMQSFGSPPSEIMGPLPPGLDLGSDGAPKLPEGCSIM